MNKKSLIPVFILVVSLFSLSFAGEIGVIVNKDLYPSVKATVDRYVEDVKSIEKKEVWLETTSFDDNSTPQQMKEAIKGRYTNNSLEGVVLVGDLPIAKYNLDSDVFACDMYYMDMNGTWSGSGSTFNGHTGNTEAEVWVSRVTCSVLESYFDDEITMTNNYFTRVTARMHGQDDIPATYTICGQNHSGHWPGLDNENIGTHDDDPDKCDLGYYKDSVDKHGVAELGSDAAVAAAWKAALIEGREYGFVYSHSSPTSHGIGYNISDQASDDMNCRFFNSYACSNGDFERANMVGGYSMDDNGLLCVGSAKTGSMRPGTFRYYNEPIGRGKSFGESFIEWFNTSTVLNDKYWHYGMNLQGAGTLKIAKYASGPYLVITSPNGGEEWEHGNTYDIKWGSNVSGNVKIELFKGGSLEKVIESSTENDGLHQVAVTTDYTVGNDYKIKISSLDNDTCISESQGNFAITSEYIISTFTYFENFDTLNAQSQVLPYKYEQLTTDDNNWTVWKGPTPSRIDDPPDVTGPEADHTTGGADGIYLYTEASASANGNPNKKFDYITPKFNFKSLKSPQLSFWYHMFSDNAGEDHMGDLCLDISVDGTWQNEVVKISGNKGDTWHEQVVDLKPYVGDRVIFRFRGITGDSWESDICIDDIRVGEDPTAINGNIHTAPLSYDLKLLGSRLHFQMPANGQQMQHVSMKLYNVQGKLVRTLIDGNVKAGYHTITLNGHKLAAGLYLCKMKVGKFTKTINVLLRK